MAKLKPKEKFTSCEKLKFTETTELLSPEQQKLIPYLIAYIDMRINKERNQGSDNVEIPVGTLSNVLSNYWEWGIPKNLGENRGVMLWNLILSDIIIPKIIDQGYECVIRKEVHCDRRLCISGWRQKKPNLVAVK